LKGLGAFKTVEEANKAFLKEKHRFACMLADLQDDPRVAKALRERYKEGSNATTNL
jgi:hypothetical protein